MSSKSPRAPSWMREPSPGSKASPPVGSKDEQENDDVDPDQDHWLFVSVQIAVLLFVVLGAPYVCRNTGLSSPARCVVVIVSVLALNLAQVMPLFCTALFIPVLGTLCEVLGDSRSMVGTSTLLVANIFNNISFLVLGALVINGIFVKCRLERRLMAFLLQHFEPDSPYFLLFLLLGGMAMCSVLYSGSLVLLTALRPLISPANGKQALQPAVAKRLLLAVAFAANAGSVWLPISSPVNLITVALLREFDYHVGLTQWVGVAIPVSTLAVLALWLVMLYIFPAKPVNNGDESQDASRVEDDEKIEMSAKDESEEQEAEVELSYAHYFFLGVAVVALLGITVLMPVLQPIVGHAACISLLVVVLTFGSGFMSREEFLQLDWDLLMLVGGTNVMAFLVRETGLGAELSGQLVGSEFFTMLPYWGFLALLIIGTVMISTTVGHTLTGVLLLPLIVAMGIKLQAAETTALLCAIAVPFGMGLPHSSFDNSSAYTESRKSGRPRVALTQRDFRIPGVAITVIAVFLLLFLGYGVCVLNYGLPPPVVVSEVSETPEKLKPKVVIENRPKEAKQVAYNKLMTNWKTFLEKPDKKAFAVGELKEGLKSRPWAASWNHETQKEANKAALDECEKLADKCRLIYPDKGAEELEELEEIEEKVKNEGQVPNEKRGVAHDAQDSSFLRNKHNASLLHVNPSFRHQYRMRRRDPLRTSGEAQ